MVGKYSSVALALAVALGGCSFVSDAVFPGRGDDRDAAAVSAAVWAKTPSCRHALSVAKPAAMATGLPDNVPA